MALPAIRLPNRSYRLLAIAAALINVLSDTDIALAGDLKRVKETRLAARHVKSRYQS